MRFIHIKDESNKLKATIAYEIIGGQAQPGMEPITEISYGVSCVSPSEPENKINYNKGRSIAQARCENAQFAKKRKQDGGTWGTKESKRSTTENGVELRSFSLPLIVALFKAMNIEKMGGCSLKDLKDAANYVRENISPNTSCSMGFSNDKS